MSVYTSDSLEEELKAAKAELAAITAHMDRELQAAAAIQRSLLPIQSPLVKGIRTAWQFRPSCHLGGDILNIFLLNERNIGFYVLDVSGHGLAASLMSVAASHFLSPFSQYSFLRERCIGQSAAQPAEVAGRLNLQFASNPEVTQFFTLVYGVINTVTLEMTYVSAGGPPPLLISRDREMILDSTGQPVGIDTEAEYSDGVVQLRKGDRLYLYSDGITEAHAPSRHLFGEERLLESLRRSADAPLADGLTGILGEVDTWCGEDGPGDDISLLAVEVG